jgi:hypothetical protein
MTKTAGPLEGSSLTPRQIRLLKITIAIMTALLVVGILALVYGMARQASKLGATAKPAAVLAEQVPYVQSLALGQGELKGVTASDGLIIFDWKAPGNEIVVILEARNGREIGRIQVPRQ